MPSSKLLADWFYGFCDIGKLCGRTSLEVMDSSHQDAYSFDGKEGFGEKRCSFFSYMLRVGSDNTLQYLERFHTKHLTDRILMCFRKSSCKTKYTKYQLIPIAKYGQMLIASHKKYGLQNNERIKWPNDQNGRVSYARKQRRAPEAMLRKTREPCWSTHILWT